MLSSTVEDYLKELYLQQQRMPAAYVQLNDLSKAMKVTAGSASVMVQGLAKDGYVDYQKRTGSRLTPVGEKIALQIVRRHRLVEAFLVTVLGLDWSEVHAEAHRWEHVISDGVLERMDLLLGRPQVDPHGDPIPDAAGEIDHTEYDNLGRAPVNVAVQVVRILDQRPEFLRYLESKDIRPGALVTVEAGDAASGAFTVRAKDAAPAIIGDRAAMSIQIRHCPSPGR